MADQEPERRFKIHPAIGVARVGNADASDFFIGPERPGLPAAGDPPGTSVPPYKVRKGAGSPARVKPQAARFHVWEYQKVAGKWTATREILLGDRDVEAIDWAAHLANRKASFFEFHGLAGEEKKKPGPRRNATRPAQELDIDPGPRRIAAHKRGVPEPVQFEPGTSDDPASERWPVCPGPVPPKGTKVIDHLGGLRTDEHGRLIVLGGTGRAASDRKPEPTLEDFANNDHWWDDVSDGPVTATVTLRLTQDGAERSVPFPAAGAWVIVGPPDFSPNTPNVVTLYDLLYDVAVRGVEIPADEAVYDGPLKALRLLHEELRGTRAQELSRYLPSFNDEIYPILQRALAMHWVFPRRFHHFPGLARLSDPSAESAGDRDAIFQRIRPPEGFRVPRDFPADMPRLWGDAFDTPRSPRMFQSITPTQYALLQRWRDGKFTKPDAPPGPVAPGPITPEGLDRAALENCSGGSFFPGIEVGWQIRAASLYSEPFRIDHDAKSAYMTERDVPVTAGHFSRQMALPWHADFAACAASQERSVFFGWWPSQRPDSVAADEASAKAGREVDWHRPTTAWLSGPQGPSAKEMVDHWAEFGFVVRRETPGAGGAPASDVYVETEREPDVPSPKPEVPFP